MALSWNEIKKRATAFSKEWENDFNEDAEAKSFMDDFFNVFGIPRRRVASFEAFVRKEDGKQGFIDLLWKGNLLIEFKSRGKDLGKAHQQAKDYFPGLKDNELPKYILVSDFERFKLYDLEDDSTIEFSLKEFVNNVQHFGFLMVNAQSIVQIHCLFAYSFGGRSTTWQLRQFLQEIHHIQFR